jgi:hypothetical protein
VPASPGAFNVFQVKPKNKRIEMYLEKFLEIAVMTVV